jgi:DNA-directed RNA polymerase sigma subunit (sigma70/sigma32)
MDHQSYPTKRKEQLLEACRVTDLSPEEVTTDIMFKHTVLKTLHKKDKGDPRYRQRNIDMFEKLYMADCPTTFKEVAEEYGISSARVVSITREYLLWLRFSYGRRRK